MFSCQNIRKISLKFCVFHIQVLFSLWQFICLTFLSFHLYVCHTKPNKIKKLKSFRDCWIAQISLKYHNTIKGYIWYPNTTNIGYCTRSSNLNHILNTPNNIQSKNVDLYSSRLITTLGNHCGEGIRYLLKRVQQRYFCCKHK